MPLSERQYSIYVIRIVVITTEIADLYLSVGSSVATMNADTQMAVGTAIINKIANRIMIESIVFPFVLFYCESWNRTNDEGVKVPCLTSWLFRMK